MSTVVFIEVHRSLGW